MFFEYSTKIEELRNVFYTTSERHKTATKSRLKGEKQDYLNIREKLKDYHPSWRRIICEIFSMELLPTKM